MGRRTLTAAPTSATRKCCARDPFMAQVKYDEVAQCVGSPCLRLAAISADAGRYLALSLSACRRRTDAPAVAAAPPAAHQRAPSTSEPARGSAARPRATEGAAPPSRRRARCAAASRCAQLGRRAGRRRCSIAPPRCSTAPTTTARSPAPRRPRARRRAPSRRTTIAPWRSCTSIASTTRATRSTLALALAPDDPETLEAAADLYINQLPPSARSLGRSASSTRAAAAGTSRAARRRARRAPGAARGAGAHRSRALARGAAPHRRRAGRRRPSCRAAQYERGVALFELCRFAEARRMFERVLATTPDHGARALPPRPHRGAHRATTSVAAQPPGRGDRARSQGLPAAARDLGRASSRSACGARSRACRPTSPPTWPASRCRRPSSRRWTT